MYYLQKFSLGCFSILTPLPGMGMSTQLYGLSWRMLFRCSFALRHKRWKHTPEPPPPPPLPLPRTDSDDLMAYKSAGLDPDSDTVVSNVMVFSIPESHDREKMDACISNRTDFIISSVINLLFNNWMLSFLCVYTALVWEIHVSTPHIAVTCYFSSGELERQIYVNERWRNTVSAIHSLQIPLLFSYSFISYIRMLFSYFTWYKF